MIAAHHIRQDEGLFYPGEQRLNHEKIIEAPADIAFAGPSGHGPPGVLVGEVRMEVAEGVYVTTLNDPVEPGPLFWEKAGILLVGGGVGQIEGFVGGIDIPAKNNGLALGPQIFTFFKKSLVEGQLEGNPFVIAAAIREVAIEQGEVRVLGNDGPALLVKFGPAQTKLDPNRLFSG